MEVVSLLVCEGMRRHQAAFVRVNGVSGRPNNALNAAPTVKDDIIVNAIKVMLLQIRLFRHIS